MNDYEVMGPQPASYYIDGSEEPSVYEINDVLSHYGMPRRSGRYPWGSGENPYQHTGDFLGRIKKLKDQGVKGAEIAKQVIGPFASTQDLNDYVSIATNMRRCIVADKARSLREDGLSLNQIKDKLNEYYKDDPLFKTINSDSVVRAYLNEDTYENSKRAPNTAEILKEALKTKPMIDVGAGTELYLNVSEDTKRQALKILEDEGYVVYKRRLSQATDPMGDHKTTLMVLCPPGTESKEVFTRLGDIKPITEFHSEDGGETFKKLEYPASMSSDRVMVRYREDGGLDRDGTIEIRRGVDDLSLGGSNYAQVRILVDDDHYMKGMAMYSDNVPDGYDVVFNTNKHQGTPKMDVLKSIKDDPENPFGSAIAANGQSYYYDPNGKYKDAEGRPQSLSPINKLKEEGDWNEQAKNLSSQFLAKQSKELIKTQLDITQKGYESEFETIMNLDNQVVKKTMLYDLANTLDGATVHLKAAALPRQRTQVILPLPDIKENEIYAPNFKNGEMVSLVRYPHAHISEIPQLIVNNNDPSGKSVLGPTTKDAVGIHPKVAERLSGADFDGDTVVVIPTNEKVRIQSQGQLKDLIGFDGKEEYGSIKTTKTNRKGETVDVYVNAKTGIPFKPLSEKAKQKEMGVVSNLITDMNLAGADEHELARAMKHSMVVIDAPKHKLDYKQSERDNNIEGLKKKYQAQVLEDGTVKYGGAATLLSKRKQDIQVPERVGAPIIDRETGELKFKESGRTYTDKKTGEVKLATKKVSKMVNTKDANDLSSGTLQETLYANYANSLKALANKCRLEAVGMKANKVDPAVRKEAKVKYQNEIKELEASLVKAKMNAPRERQAQVIANSTIDALLQENASLKEDKSAVKKIRDAETKKARGAVGASGSQTKIVLNDKTWAAIQSGALPDSRCAEIFKYCDKDQLKKYATPKEKKGLSSVKMSLAQSMLKQGHTRQEVADALGVSVSTLYNNGL